MEDMQRIESGVPGMDRLIEGGFPYPMILIIEGEPGTGKSTLALQMLFHNCEGKRRLYLSGISEPFENMRRNMGRHKFFDWAKVEGGCVQLIDISKAIGLGAEARLTPIRESELSMDEPFVTIIRKIEEHSPDIVAIDPLLTSFSPESLKYRKIFYDFFKVIRDLGVFMIIVKETTDKTARSVDNYMADGVISLGIRPLRDQPNEYRKVARITKLRGTKHSNNVMQIDKDWEGISLLPLEQEINGNIP